MEEGIKKRFSSSMLNDKIYGTVLERMGRHFFKIQGGLGEPKLKPGKDISEQGFKGSIVWSLTYLPDT